MSYANSKQEQINTLHKQIKFVKKVITNKTHTLQNILLQISSEAAPFITNSKMQAVISPTRKTQALHCINIVIPKNTDIFIKPVKSGSALFIAGARGLIYILIADKKVTLEKNDRLLLIKISETKDISELSWLNNIYRIFVGVNRGYKKHINIVGVGYKSFLLDSNIFKLVLGYSHNIYYKLNNKVKILLGRKNNKFIMRGTSLPLISNITASVRQFKKPDIYRGKGLRYRGIALPFKEGKKKK